MRDFFLHTQTPFVQLSYASSYSYNHGDLVMMTASSYHTGGCNVVMGDGSVQFISDTINSKRSDYDSLLSSGAKTHKNGGESYFGVWGSPRNT